MAFFRILHLAPLVKLFPRLANLNYIWRAHRPRVDHNHPGAGNGSNTRYVWDAKPFRKVEVSPRFRAVNADGLPESDEAAWGHQNLESIKHASALS